VTDVVMMLQTGRPRNSVSIPGKIFKVVSTLEG
jgi:hypothetical protein